MGEDVERAAGIERKDGLEGAAEDKGAPGRDDTAIGLSRIRFQAAQACQTVCPVLTRATRVSLPITKENNLRELVSFRFKYDMTKGKSFGPRLHPAARWDNRAAARGAVAVRSGDGVSGASRWPSSQTPFPALSPPRRSRSARRPANSRRKAATSSASAPASRISTRRQHQGCRHRGDPPWRDQVPAGLRHRAAARGDRGQVQARERTRLRPEQTIVGTGGKQILFNAFMATLNPGDEAIIPPRTGSAIPRWSCLRRNARHRRNHARRRIQAEAGSA